MRKVGGTAGYAVVTGTGRGEVESPQDEPASKVPIQKPLMPKQNQRLDEQIY